MRRKMEPPTAAVMIMYRCRSDLGGKIDATQLTFLTVW